MQRGPVNVKKIFLNISSWCNYVEIDEVVRYVNYLLINGVNGKRISENDIGIISPYSLQVAVNLLLVQSWFNFNIQIIRHLQCQKIEMELQKKGRNILTASVERFQGKEKSVIIVSTVRTGRQRIGFRDSPQVSVV